MPSTTVKLCSSDARAWTRNQPVWLDEAGEVARPVSREEQHAISKALERSRRLKQSFRADLPILPLNKTGRKTSSTARGAEIPRLRAAFEIGFVGEKRVVTVWNERLRYATGREVLAARLLADHGECVLHGRNGKCIGVLRDPFSTQRDRVPGPRVQWSRDPKDPRKNEAERSELTREFDEARIAPVKRKRRARPVGPQLALYSPAKCPNDCRGLRGGQAWKIPDSAVPPTPDEHHPTCQHAPAWARTLELPETTDVLFDLETSEVKRSAIPDEIEEANHAEARTGIRQVTVAGRVYAVLSRADAEQAAAEARGELESEGDEDDVDLGGAGNGELESVGAPLVRSNPDARADWPTLDELSPGARILSRTGVKASDYLTRPSGAEPAP